MSISYRNITCQRHPPVIELFFLFGTLNHFFCRFLLENHDLQPKCHLLNYLYFISNEALIGFFFILYVAGPAGNTKTHIRISINPGFPQLYPKIYSLFFEFHTSCGVHVEIFTHTSEFGSSPCSFVRLMTSNRLVHLGSCRQETLSRSVLNHFCDRVLIVFMAPAQRGVQLSHPFCKSGFWWDNSVIGSFHSFNLKSLWLEAPKTVKDHEMGVFKDL